MLTAHSRDKSYRSLSEKLFVMALFTFVSWIATVQSAPCVAQTNFYGMAESANYTEVVERVDDSTRISSMYYCLAWQFGVWQHFRGFRATFESDSGTVTQTFGSLDEGSDFCEEVTIDEEIMYVTVYSDTNDVEGLVFEGHLGTEYVFRANGEDSSPKFRMAGRPIGFGIYMGDTPYITNSPLKMSIMYNECNCPASTFMARGQPPDLRTQVGGAADTQTLPYQDNYMEYTYAQDCGSYTVTLSPDYSFLSLASTGSVGTSGHQYSDQITLQSTSAADIGQHTVTMTVSQEAANNDGYAQPYTGQMPAISYTFLATIDPCAVTQFSLTLSPSGTPITYTLGDTATTGGEYLFEQTPTSCGYTINYDVTNLPAFVTHQEATNDFLISQTTDRSLTGSHTATVRGYLQVPDDYTQTTFVTWEQTFSVTFEVIDPCETSSFEAYSVADMEIGSAVLTQVLATPTDSVSLALGDQSGTTFCGTRSITIDSVTPSVSSISDLLTLDYSGGAYSVTAETLDSTHEGTYEVVLAVELDDYPTVQATASFFITIASCTLTSIEVTQVAAQTYVVYTPQLSFTWALFDSSECPDMTLDYTVAVKDTSLGTFSTVSDHSFLTENGQAFEVSSTDVLDVGEYEVIITGTTPADTNDPPLSEELVISLTLTDDCATDTVTPTSSIADIDYRIGETGQVALAPTWSTTVAGCPVVYEMYQVMANTSVQALTGTETAVVSFDSADGSLEIETTDLATYDEESWDLRVVKKSVYGTAPSNEGIYDFTITFTDPCWLSTLTAATTDPSFTFELYTLQSMTATLMADVEYGSACGGFTYALEWLSGPLTGTGIDPLGTFSLTETTQLEVSGTPATREWIGTHSIRIKCTNGSVANAPLGDGTGLYNSVYSDPFDLIITDPCPTTVLDTFTIADMTALADASTFTSSAIAGPSDSVSGRLGSGYGLCGPLSYSVIEDSAELPAGFTLNLTENPNAADSMTFSFESYPFGYEASSSVTMLVESVDYSDDVEPLQVPFTVAYRTCKPDAMSIEGLSDQDYTVGEEEQGLTFTVNTSPCEGYTLSGYKAVVVAANGAETLLPEFIELSETTLTWSSEVAEDVGTYTVRVYASLYRVDPSQAEDEAANNLLETVFADYTLTVNPEPIVEVIESTYVPKWEFGLEDQTVTVGEQVLIPVSLREDDELLESEFKVDLGTADSFVSWDGDLEEFSVLAVDQTGTHEVCMSAAYFNSTYREEFSDCFSIQIQPSPLEQVPQEPSADQADDLVAWAPPSQAKEVVEIRQIGPQFVVSDLGDEMGPEAPNQPVPYIQGLSVAGQLTIGWDRQMTPAEEYEAINPARVGIRDEETLQETVSLTDNDREGERRRHLVYRHEGWYQTDLTTEEEWLLVVEALELRIQPGDYADEQALNLTWSMMVYTEQQLKLQLDFEHPERVSENNLIEYDTLEVFFWGVDWFKSDKGEPVRYGTKLETKIVRQVDPEVAQEVSSFGKKLATSVASMMLFLAVATGKLLPTWLFINSLQLIAHLPLFQSALPPKTALFMSQYLDICRFDLMPSLTNSVLDKLGLASNAHLDEGPLYLTFQSFGYESLYLAKNASMIGLLFSVCLALLLIAGVKDLVATLFCKRAEEKSFLKQKHSFWVFNFTLRLFIESLMVLLVTSLISIRKDSQEAAVQEGMSLLDLHSESRASNSDTKIAYTILGLTGLLVLYSLVTMAVRKCMASSTGPSVLDQISLSGSSKTGKTGKDKSSGSKEFQFASTTTQKVQKHEVYEGGSSHGLMLDLTNKQKIKESIRLQAKRNVEAESLAASRWRKTHPCTRTLAYGLRDPSDFPSYILLFTARRVLFALTIVLAHDRFTLGLYCLIFTSFSLLTLQAKSQGLWADRLIQIQFIGNELFILQISLTMLVFSGAYDLGYEAQQRIGSALIWSLVAFCGFNMSMMVVSSVQSLVTYCRRRRGLKSRQSQSAKLEGEAAQSHAKLALNEYPSKMDNTEIKAKHNQVGFVIDPKELSPITLNSCESPSKLLQPTEGASPDQDLRPLTLKSKKAPIFERINLTDMTAVEQSNVSSTSHLMLHTAEKLLMTHNSAQDTDRHDQSNQVEILQIPLKRNEMVVPKDEEMLIKEVDPYGVQGYDITKSQRGAIPISQSPDRFTHDGNPTSLIKMEQNATPDFNLPYSKVLVQQVDTERQEPIREQKQIVAPEMPKSLQQPIGTRLEEDGLEQTLHWIEQEINQTDQKLLPPSSLSSQSAAEPSVSLCVSDGLSAQSKRLAVERLKETTYQSHFGEEISKISHQTNEPADKLSTYKNAGIKDFSHLSSFSVMKQPGKSASQRHLLEPNSFNAGFTDLGRKNDQLGSHQELKVPPTKHPSPPRYAKYKLARDDCMRASHKPPIIKLSRNADFSKSERTMLHKPQFASSTVLERKVNICNDQEINLFDQQLTEIQSLARSKAASSRNVVFAPHKTPDKWVTTVQEEGSTPAQASTKQKPIVTRSHTQHLVLKGGVKKKLASTGQLQLINIQKTLAKRQRSHEAAETDLRARADAVNTVKDNNLSVVQTLFNVGLNDNKSV